MMANLKLMSMRTRMLTLICLLAATPCWSRVLLRWSQPSIPAPATMGVTELVVTWDNAELITSARRRGYRVYAEVPVGKPADLAHSTAKNSLAGIIFNPGDAQPREVDEELGQLRSAYPHLPVLLLNPKANQPQMKGQLVIKKDGILQVTSPTAQPWIDSNLALVRFDQAFRPVQAPLYEFHWDVSDSQQPEGSPAPEDYALAVAEAGAFHVDLVLGLPPALQADLAQNSPAAQAVLIQIRRYLAFAARGEKNAAEPEANVGVITDSYQKSYEPTNLFARHNIPFAVLNASDLKPQSLERFNLVVVFATPDDATIKMLVDFASKGGVVVVVDAQGPYPWQSTQRVPAGEYSVAYATGKGRIIELQGQVTDPGTFAQDVRRLLDQDKDKLALSLWNALTVVAVSYRSTGGGKLVELVNYAEEPISVQVRIQGSFSSIRYETPEQVCCESLTATQRGAFTEFVVPSLRIAGRVHLAGRKPADHKAEGNENHAPPFCVLHCSALSAAAPFREPGAQERFQEFLPHVRRHLYRPREQGNLCVPL